MIHFSHQSTVFRKVHLLTPQLSLHAYMELGVLMFIYSIHCVPQSKVYDP